MEARLYYDEGICVDIEDKRYILCDLVIVPVSFSYTPPFFQTEVPSNTWSSAILVVLEYTSFNLEDKILTQAVKAFETSILKPKQEQSSMRAYIMGGSACSVIICRTTYDLMTGKQANLDESIKGAVADVAVPRNDYQSALYAFITHSSIMSNDGDVILGVNRAHEANYL